MGCTVRRMNEWWRFRFISWSGQRVQPYITAIRSGGNVDVLSIPGYWLICPKYHSTACSNLILSHIIILLASSSLLLLKTIYKQYAGVHWSKNKALFYKHIEDYKKCTATIFKECNLFVIWGMIVAKDYDGLTEHFVQLDDDTTKHLSKTELSNLLKERLQCTTWSY